jgi:hypothetical protein
MFDCCRRWSWFAHEVLPLLVLSFTTAVVVHNIEVYGWNYLVRLYSSLLLCVWFAFVPSAMPNQVVLIARKQLAQLSDAMKPFSNTIPVPSKVNALKIQVCSHPGNWSAASSRNSRLPVSPFLVSLSCSQTVAAGATDPDPQDVETTWWCQRVAPFTDACSYRNICYDGEFWYFIDRDALKKNSSIDPIFWPYFDFKTGVVYPLKYPVPIPDENTMFPFNGGGELLIPAPLWLTHHHLVVLAYGVVPAYRCAREAKNATDARRNERCCDVGIPCAVVPRVPALP